MGTPDSFLEMSSKFQAKMRANEEEMRMITEQVEVLAEVHAAEMLEKERKARSHEELAANLMQLMLKRKAENEKLATCQELLVAFQENVSTLGLDIELRIPASVLVQPSGEPAKQLRHELKVEDLQAWQHCASPPVPLSVWTTSRLSSCRTKAPMAFEEWVASSNGSRKRQKSSRGEVIVLSSDDSGDEMDGVGEAKPLVSSIPDLKIPQSDQRDIVIEAGSDRGSLSEVYGAVESSVVHAPESGGEAAVGATPLREPEAPGAIKEADLGQSSTSGGGNVQETEAVSKEPIVDGELLPEVGARKDVEQGPSEDMRLSIEAVTSVQPVKRKRGRPRKHPLPHTVAALAPVAESATSLTTSVAESAITLAPLAASLPIRRRPGRPRKHPPKPGQLAYEKLGQVTTSTPHVYDTAGQLPALRLSEYMKNKAAGLRLLSGRLMGAICERLEHVMSQVGAAVEIPPLVQVTQPADFKLGGWDDVDSLNSAGFQQMFTKHAYEFAVLLQENVKKHLWQPKWYLRKALEAKRKEHNRAFESIVMAFSSNGFRDYGTQQLRDELRESIETFVKLYRSNTKDHEPLQDFKLRMAKSLVDEWELKYWRYQVPDEAYHDNIHTDGVFEGYNKLMAAGRHSEAAAVKQLLDVVQATNSIRSTLENDPDVPNGISLVGKRVKVLVKGVKWFEGDVIHYSYCDNHYVMLLTNDQLKSINLAETKVCTV